MAELSAKQRDALDKRDFAYVDKTGGEHLPIHDASHVRNAIARWNQTHFETKSAKAEARKKVLKAAEKFGIEVSEDDAIRRDKQDDTDGRSPLATDRRVSA